MVYKGICFLNLYIFLFNFFHDFGNLFGFSDVKYDLLEQLKFSHIRKVLGGISFPTFVYVLIIFIVNCRKIFKKI
jgi:hypothetical protein